MGRRPGVAGSLMLPIEVMRSGGSAAAVLLKDATYDDFAPSGSAAASFTLAANGMASGGPWATPADAANYTWRDGESGAAYEVDVAAAPVAPTSGPTGAGINLGTTRTWLLSNDVPGTTYTCTLTITLRRAGGGAILSVKTIVLEATVDAGSGGGGGDGPPPADGGVLP